MIPQVIFGMPLDTDGMAGEIRTVFGGGTGGSMGGPVVPLLIEQRLGSALYACWAPVNVFHADDPVGLRTIQVRVQDVIDRFLRPWTQGDSWKGWPDTLEPLRSVAAVRHTYDRLVGLWEWVRWPRDKWGSWRRSE